MTDPSRTDLIARLPKVELHLHLEGSVTPELALTLARRSGTRIPGDHNGHEGIKAAYRFTHFRDFLELYLAITKCFVTASDYAEVVIDLCRRLARQNVRYAEVTFTPSTHLVQGRSAELLHEGLAEGRARGREKYGVELGWVFDIVRSVPDYSESTVDFALAHREYEDCVIGLGVGGPEGDHYPMDAIIAAFARARAEGLRSLPHAGENAGAQSMWCAVNDLKADRIGHGIRCLEDDTLVAHLAERGIPLEVCPHSNLALGIVASLAEHPLPKLIAAGIRVSLGSDDPPLFHTDLLNEYTACAAAFGWDEAEVARLAACAVSQSFAPPQLAASIRAEQQAVLAGAPTNRGAGT